MVLYSTNFLMKLIPCIKDNLSPILQFGILLGAFGHDLNHSGYNNSFEIAAISRLAIRYSDKSPLEYNHIYILFKILSSSEVDFLSKITPID